MSARRARSQAEPGASDRDVLSGRDVQWRAVQLTTSVSAILGNVRMDEPGWLRSVTPKAILEWRKIPAPSGIASHGTDHLEMCSSLLTDRCVALPTFEVATLQSEWVLRFPSGRS